MPVAILSDIHSNLEALTAVLQDIEAQGVQDIYGLGDLTGYGPNPAEVVDLAMNWKVVTLGNHEEAVLKGAYGFNPAARSAVEWTREQLKPGFFSGKSKRDRWAFLENLPRTHAENGNLMVHASPRDPTMEYILRSDTIDLLGDVPDKLKDIFSRFDHLCFHGHTHDPGIITEAAQFLSPDTFGYTYTFDPHKKYIIDVGSVGQPRDTDTRACYTVLDGETITYRRVAYDFKKTMEKILKIPELDRRSAERLALGR